MLMFVVCCTHPGLWSARFGLCPRQGEHSALLVGAATPVDVDELIDLL
jgi:hypothetical protein